MLYPIELLRQTFAPHADGVTQRTACMLTGMPVFVMSSVGFLRVGGCATGWRVGGWVSQPRCASQRLRGGWGGGIFAGIKRSRGKLAPTV